MITSIAFVGIISGFWVVAYDEFSHVGWFFFIVLAI